MVFGSIKCAKPALVYTRNQQAVLWLFEKNMELMAAAGEGKILVFHHVDDRLNQLSQKPTYYQAHLLCVCMYVVCL
jgi:hypothetical protein